MAEKNKKENSGSPKKNSNLEGAIEKLSKGEELTKKEKNHIKDYVQTSSVKTEDSKNESDKKNEEENKKHEASELEEVLKKLSKGEKLTKKEQTDVKKYIESTSSSENPEREKSKETKEKEETEKKDEEVEVSEETQAEKEEKKTPGREIEENNQDIQTTQATQPFNTLLNPETLNQEQRNYSTVSDRGITNTTGLEQAIGPIEGISKESEENKTSRVDYLRKPGDKYETSGQRDYQEKLKEDYELEIPGEETEARERERQAREMEAQEKRKTNYNQEINT